MEKEFFIHVEQFRRVAKAFFTDFDTVANLRRCFSGIFDLSPTGDTIFRHEQQNRNPATGYLNCFLLYLQHKNIVFNPIINYLISSLC